MGMCLNKKVIGGLALAGLAIFLVAPGAIGAALPLLVFAACPLSMIVMMRAMSGSGRSACATGDEGEGDKASEEIVKLRAEVDQLRAEQAGRVAPIATTDVHGTN